MSIGAFPLSIGILPAWFRTRAISSGVAVACKSFTTIATLKGICLYLAGGFRGIVDAIIPFGICCQLSACSMWLHVPPCQGLPIFQQSRHKMRVRFPFGSIVQAATEGTNKRAAIRFHPEKGRAGSPVVPPLLLLWLSACSPAE